MTLPADLGEAAPVSRAMPWWLRRPRLANRLGALALLVVTASMPALSFVLVPSAQGEPAAFRLLGPPCLFRLLTGLPCPLCGMTRAFVAMAQGHVAQAFEAHVLGPAAYTVTWVVALWALECCVTGRRPIPELTGLVRMTQIAFLVLLGGWAVNLLRVLL
ncbi:DUF2752 domain-containing protein [bacterium]|nr:DUF2752 domain-containing protein [bacterium]